LHLHIHNTITPSLYLTTGTQVFKVHNCTELFLYVASSCCKGFFFFAVCGFSVHLIWQATWGLPYKHQNPFVTLPNYHVLQMSTGPCIWVNICRTRTYLLLTCRIRTSTSSPHELHELRQLHSPAAMPEGQGCPSGWMQGKGRSRTPPRSWMKNQCPVRKMRFPLLQQATAAAQQQQH